MKNGFENITLIDTKTNAQLGEIHTDYKMDEVNLSSFQKDISRKYEDRSLLAIHNHPGNSTFSPRDIFSLVENKKNMLYSCFNE